MNIYHYPNHPVGFYVYAYLRKDGTPYYVGKGKGRRWKHAKRERYQTPKDLTKIIVLEHNLTEVGANRKGNSLSEEHKKNIALARLGKKYPRNQ